MEQFLGRHGFQVAVMKADAVPPERREAWVAKRVEEGADVLVCHPRLVQTGLDLIDFPTIVRLCRSSSWPTGTPCRRTPSSWCQQRSDCDPGPRR